MKNNAKVIFHIDLNAFSAAVAEILNPSLRNKAFGIGHNSRRGVLSTASYEARKYGITSAMSIQEALRRYPKLLIVPADWHMINYYSMQFLELLKTYSPLVEQASVDEAYLDVTNSDIHPLILAKKIQDEVYKRLQLKCSIGIAPTLFLAKMASDLKKPMGISVVRIRDISQILYPLDVKDIQGIGKKTYPYLHQLNIKTIGDFCNPLNKATILKVISENHYLDVIACLTGKSSNQVVPNRYSELESIGHSQTYLKDLIDIDEILNELSHLTKMSYERLLKQGKIAKTIQITLKYSNFKQITRSFTLSEATNDFYLLYDTVETLVEEHYNFEPIRLLGVSFSSLSKPEARNENLFTISDVVQKEAEVIRLMKDINQKYQKELIKKGLD